MLPAGGEVVPAALDQAGPGGLGHGEVPDQDVILAPQLLDSSAAEGEEGWWQSFTGGLADIFQVRRADTDSSAERAEDIVAEVEEEIEAGDVEGAVAAYLRLPDDIQRRGARWLRDAQRYMQTENLLARLEARVVDASGELTAPREAPAQDSSGTTQL